jgi:hypothetical protein
LTRDKLLDYLLTTMNGLMMRARLVPEPLACLDPTAKYGPISLEIAVTGHRDLAPEDEAYYQTVLAAILDGLMKQYAYTRPLLLTGLAVGADTIAAKLALSKDIGYVAVLPMPLEVYRTDFKTEAADQDFQYLLDRAEGVIELPLAQGSTLADIAHDGPARDRQYEDLGRFLVNYSQVLVAVWDQDKRIKPGGTAQVVSFKLHRFPTGAHFEPLNASGAGPVYIISARRASGEGSGALLGPHQQDYPKGSDEGDYAEIYRLIDDFNRDATKSGPGLRDQVVASRQELLSSAPADLLPLALHWLADVYSIADILSTHYRDWSDRIQKYAFLAAGLAIIPLVGFHEFHFGVRALAAYYLLLAMVGAMVGITSKRNLQRRYLDYRALAEALRVQFFWTVIGLPALAPDHYLEKQAGEVSWIRDALSECAFYGGVPGGGESSRYEFGRTWIGSQIKFFARRIVQKRRTRSSLWMVAGILAAIGAAAPLGTAFTRPDGQPVFNALAVLALAWASLVFSYVELRGYSQETREYQRMYELFQRSDAEIEDCLLSSNLKRAEGIFNALGRAALAENGDWLLLHRERKLSLKDILK